MAAAISRVRSAFERQVKKRQQNLDRFIPNRSAMDFGYAHYMLTEGFKFEREKAECFPARETYRSCLARAFNMDRSRRILAFKNKPPTPIEAFREDLFFPVEHLKKSVQPCRYIPQSSEKVVEVPGVRDDLGSSLLHWGANNQIAICMENLVGIWDATDGSADDLVTIDDGSGPVTSVKWAPDGRHISLGLYNSDIQIWDVATCTVVNTIRGAHESRVGAMDWSTNSLLTTGGSDGQIVQIDIRIRNGNNIVKRIQGHQEEIFELKWSPCGRHLASGGNDNLLLWDISSAGTQNQYLHRMDHTDLVKGLAWSPFQSNLLASGGGGLINFWNTHTGVCQKSVDTGSQVSGLLWNKNVPEVLSSHGYPRNELNLWRYPSLSKMAELTGHTSRILYLTESPDACAVATAAGDGTFRTWLVFGNLQVAKAAPKAAHEPFTLNNRSSIR